MRESLKTQLEAGRRSLQLPLSDAQYESLLDFIALIDKWNRVYNLTAVRDVTMMLEAHVFDSLAVLPHLHGGRCIDVGSGAGLPGIPLAIADPQRQWLLVDSQIKRSRFQLQAIAELQLSNVMVEHARVQDVSKDKAGSTVICRAYSSLAAFAADAQHLCAEDGVLLAMKAEYPHAELTQLAASIEVVDVVSLPVIGQPKQRHLVKMRPVKSAQQ